MAEDEIMLRKEAAKRCLQPTREIDKAIMTGKLEYFRRGPLVYITESARKAWFASFVPPVMPVRVPRRRGRPSLVELTERAAASAVA
jgi:hypothetical protein